MLSDLIDGHGAVLFQICSQEASRGAGWCAAQMEAAFSILNPASRGCYLLAWSLEGSGDPQSAPQASYRSRTMTVERP